MNGLDTVTVFKKHPDRYNGTWWPMKVGKAKAARIACPKCGELAVLMVKLHEIKRDGIVGVPTCCPKEGCWLGVAKLEGWNS